MNTVLVDIDGTIADCNHRLHFVQGKPRNYKKFYEGIPYDTPIVPTITTVTSLWRVGFNVVFLTARDEWTRDMTKEWIGKHIPYLIHSPLFMRPDKDSRPDHIIKEEIFLSHIRPNFAGPYVVFEDRGRVIDMWRRNGVFCFNANQGEDY